MIISVYKKPSELTPYFRNPRKNDFAVIKCIESIKKYGFQTPILCDENFLIIAGHTRLKAALELGLETIPVNVTDELDEKQINEYRIIDNRLQEFAEWDYELLEIEQRKFDEKIKDLLEFEIPNLKN